MYTNFLKNQLRGGGGVVGDNRVGVTGQIKLKKTINTICTIKWQEKII